MKNLIALTIGLLITVTAIAQDTASVEGPWKYDGMTAFQMQVALGLNPGKKQDLNLVAL
ncbi:MAG: hypothetical protein U9N72_02395 [Bacteroidota bacterium]|nr:hypothetical protein [Bacteroidota bacterium]